METISVSTAARTLKCSTTHIYRLLSAGYLEGYRSGRRHYVSKESLDLYIETHTHGGQLDVSLSYARLVAEHPDWQKRHTHGK